MERKRERKRGAKGLDARRRMVEVAIPEITLKGPKRSKLV